MFKNKKELLSKAKTELGIKGKRRSNPVTTAIFLNYIPKGKKGKNLQEGSQQYEKSVNDEILRRYVENNILYTQTITFKTKSKYKNQKDNKFTPLDITFTAEGSKDDIKNAL